MYDDDAPTGFFGTFMYCLTAGNEAAAQEAKRRVTQARQERAEAQARLEAIERQAEISYHEDERRLIQAKAAKAQAELQARQDLMVKMNAVEQAEYELSFQRALRAASPEGRQLLLQQRINEERQLAELAVVHQQRLSGTYQSQALPAPQPALRSLPSPSGQPALSNQQVTALAKKTARMDFFHEVDAEFELARREVELAGRYGENIAREIRQMADEIRRNGRR